MCRLFLWIILIEYEVGGERWIDWEGSKVFSDFMAEKLLKEIPFAWSVLPKLEWAPESPGGLLNSRLLGPTRRAAGIGLIVYLANAISLGTVFLTTSTLDQLWNPWLASQFAIPGNPIIKYGFYSSFYSKFLMRGEQDHLFCDLLHSDAEVLLSEQICLDFELPEHRPSPHLELTAELRNTKNLWESLGQYLPNFCDKTHLGHFHKGHLSTKSGFSVILTI